jgi:hypothetical protein
MKSIVSDKKTPFVARYTLYQQQMAEKQREVDGLKIEVFEKLLGY